MRIVVLVDLVVAEGPYITITPKESHSYWLKCLIFLYSHPLMKPSRKFLDQLLFPVSRYPRTLSLVFVRACLVVVPWTVYAWMSKFFDSDGLNVFFV